MKESDIEAYLIKRVKQLEGEVRKVRWINRNGAPDRLVLLKNPNRQLWIELKATGKQPEKHQLREHIRMRGYGLTVHVVDSFESADRVLNA